MQRAQTGTEYLLIIGSGVALMILAFTVATGLLNTGKEGAGGQYQGFLGGITSICSLSSDFNAISVVACWRFENTFENTAGSLHTGQKTGVVNFSSGKKGSGIYFAGPDNSVIIPDHAAFKGLAKITISAWFNTSENANKRLVTKYNANNDGEWYLATLSGNAVRFTVINSANSEINCDMTVTPYTNNWHMLTGTYDGTIMNVYFDGVKKAVPCAQSGTIKSTAHRVKLGEYEGQQNSSWNYNGKLDEVIIFNRALSESEVVKMYSSYG